jgi:deoxycytidylate deaminase
MTLPSYFRMAKKAMLLSDSRFRLGACILLKRKVISIGFNQMLRSHPLVRKYDQFDAIHAEVSAILRLKNKELLIGSTVIVYRETKDGIPTLAKPCKVCQKILKEFGISKAIYTTDNGFETLTL